MVEGEFGIGVTDLRGNADACRCRHRFEVAKASAFSGTKCGIMWCRCVGLSLRRSLYCPPVGLGDVQYRGGSLVSCCVRDVTGLKVPYGFRGAVLQFRGSVCECCHFRDCEYASGGLGVMRLGSLRQRPQHLLYE